MSMVKDRTTYEDRRDEIDRWMDSPGYGVLLELDRKLAELDPGYNLIQVKIKFGGLRYYIQTKAHGADELVRKAEDDFYNAINPGS